MQPSLAQGQLLFGLQAPDVLEWPSHSSAPEAYVRPHQTMR